MSFNNPCTYHIPALEKPFVSVRVFIFFNFFFTHERYTVESHEPSIFSKFLSFLPPVSIGNSMICSDIWHKYHEWYFEIVIRNFETILKYHEWYLCQISLQIMLLFVYTTTRKRFVIFTCRYFKLSWNTTALSQSNCRNFSCSGWDNKVIPPIFSISLYPLGGWFL